MWGYQVKDFSQTGPRSLMFWHLLLYAQTAGGREHWPKMNNYDMGFVGIRTCVHVSESIWVYKGSLCTVSTFE